MLHHKLKGQVEHRKEDAGKERYSIDRVLSYNRCFQAMPILGLVPR